MSLKSFQDLINDVHDKGVCQECGGCVSFCSAADFHIIDFIDKYSPPVYVKKDECLECGICYYLCPQTHVSDYDLNKTFTFSDYNSMPIGPYYEIHSCQATDSEFLKYGSDGGVVNSIINFLIEKKVIDGAIVAKTEAPFSREATFVNKKEDLLKYSGALLDISPQLTEIQKFSTYTHTIPELKKYSDNKLAVVGTPCQVYTMRCMQELGVTPSQNIEICLGLFCFENFLFDKHQIKKFEKDFNIQLENIKKINIKEDLIISFKDHKKIQIPFNHLTDYMRPACNACNNFTNIYADISFGGLGSPDKHTTVIVRTKKGKEIISDALTAGIIKKIDLDSERKEMLIELITQYSRLKIQRYEKFTSHIMKAH